MRFGAKLAIRRLITAVMTVTPPPIVVRTMSKDGAAQLSISLQQIVAADKPPKERTLLRAAAEPLSKSLARLAAGSSAVLRDASGAPIDPQTPAGDAYAAAASLDLDAETRAVWYCPAEVLELDLPVAPFVGLPLLPQLATAGCDADAVRLVWERRAEPSAPWEPIARSGGIFVPTGGDVGAQLRVRAVPPPPRGASAEEAEAARLGRTLELPAVRRLPPRPSFAARLASLESDGAARAGCTRVLSYNLLADAYRHHWDDPGGVHSFCDPALTAAANRLPALLDELLMVDADVLCLQEVDAVFWETFWRPQLELAGYAGAYTRKVGEQSQEGCAVVVRRSRFDIVEARSVTLRLEPPPPPLAPLLAAHPQTAEAVASLPTVGQLLRLRAAEGGREVLVLNSHLYFANPAVHVRLMQTAALLDEAMRWRDALKQESGGGGAAPALLVCGDFNSDRTDAVVHLLLRGVVEPTHPDWATGLFTWLKSSGCIPTARRAAADLAQRLALEGEGDAAEAPAPPAAAPAEANGGGGGGAACARAWAAAEEERELAARWHTLRKGVRLLRDVRPPADGGATTEDAARLRGAALRDAARGRTALDSAACAAYALAELTGKSPHDAPALVAAAQPLLDSATAELQAVLSRFEPYRGTESFNGFTGNLIRVAERAAAPDAGGGGAPPDGLGVRLELPVALESAYGDHAAPTHVTTSYVNCLDWIFVDKAAFKVRAAATLPPLEAMQRHTALPSQEFPSDHVWLACDVEWK